jgi:sugar phosphate isomerase/epimerase
MRFGAMNFPIKPILDELKALGALGLDYVELAMDPPQAHHIQLRQQKRSIRQAQANCQLGLLCHLPTFVYTADLTPSIRQASLEEILGALETAAELEAEKVVLHPSYIGGLASYVMEQAMALAMDTFDQVARRAAVLGVTVCVENMFPRYRPFVEPQDFAPIFKTFPQFKLVLDIGHAHMDNPAGDRAAGFLTQFSDRLAHIHISDNHGRRDDHLPVGHGSVAFHTLIRSLCHLGYDGTFTLEIFSQDREDLIRSKQKLIRMHAKARAEVVS